MRSANSRIVNVTAIDEDGQPATDLTATDFQLFDDNRLQAIVMVNRLSALGSQRATILVLFDLLNTIPGQRENSATLIARALQPLESGDFIFLYLLTNYGELYPVHPLSVPPQKADSSNALTRAEHPNASWTQQVRPLLDQAIEKVNARRLKDFQDQGTRTAATFLALDDIGNAFTKIQGPKTIVWITRGAANWVDYPYGCKDAFFTEGSANYLAGRCGNDCTRAPGVSKCMDYTPFLQRFGMKLVRSDTMLYSVVVNPQFSELPVDRGTPMNTLQQLSDLSGGRLYVRGEIEKAIAQSLLDIRSRYQLIYEAPDPNGRYHKLKVDCSRKDVRLEAPKGYFAEKP